MKRSVLSKAVGTAVISFNLAMLPLLLPVSAQTSTAPGSSTTGSTTDAPDPNINPTTESNTAPSSSTSDTTGTSSSTNTGTNSTAPSDTTTGTGSASGSFTTEGSTTPSGSDTGTGATPSDMNTGSSSAPSAATGSTNSESNTTQSITTEGESHSSWGWLGLLGLTGLAGLLRKPARSSVENDQLQAQLNTANDRIEQGVAKAGEGIGHFLGELKTDVNDFKERRAKEKEAKEIKNALGRPSTRVILDRQDNVILNVGDLITNKAVERARTADMLDVLLNSVDEQRPAIDEEERSAPVPGEASLEERQSETSINSHRV